MVLVPHPPYHRLLIVLWFFWNTTPRYMSLCGVYTYMHYLHTRHTHTHSPLVQRVVGPDPALVEWAVITSRYGATPQDYHADEMYHASHIPHGRSYRPLWSIFIPLQDTTLAMGATQACPRLHTCFLPHDDDHSLCHDHGFAVATNNNNTTNNTTNNGSSSAAAVSSSVWKAGDAF